eukprot:CAMPEP_0170552992 /NCGR_PEP_ID=MMETSP0211-20121228/10874_1 /TAXON_ID=311385 /ORGANISM="Pseudokeronopsis sp., Strain OXSARD2" /LENGTH=65 /DNA_ID=CAMNT_0010861087 /DNA_START=310 /DNA_END=504 /DNA_ORIENTATION=-
MEGRRIKANPLVRLIIMYQMGLHAESSSLSTSSLKSYFVANAKRRKTRLLEQAMKAKYIIEACRW